MVSYCPQTKGLLLQSELVRSSLNAEIIWSELLIEYYLSKSYCLKVSVMTRKTITATELLEHYAAGERAFRNIQEISFGLHSACDILSGVNLSGIDLSGTVLEERSLETTNFTKAILRKTNFFESGLDDAIFREADLTKASLFFADLDGADLSYAKLIEANLGGASMIGANLTGADLTRADLAGTYLDKANLTDANLFEALIGDAEAGFAYLETAIFCNTTMPDGSIRTDIQS